MRIIWTNATEDELKKDHAQLLRAHKRATKEELTWSAFGGIITVNGRKYQVVEERKK